MGQAVKRILVAVIALAVVSTLGLGLGVDTPAKSATPCDVALSEAAEVEALLDNNAPTTSRQRNLEADQRAFIAQVRARCAPPPTTTTVAPTTTAAPTTTTAPPVTTTTAPPGGNNFLADPSAHGYPDADNTGPSGPLTPERPDTGIVILILGPVAAAYVGRCQRCWDTIFESDEIVMLSTKEWVHEWCAPRPATNPWNTTGEHHR